MGKAGAHRVFKGSGEFGFDAAEKSFGQWIKIVKADFSKVCGWQDAGWVAVVWRIRKGEWAAVVPEA